MSIKPTTLICIGVAAAFGLLGYCCTQHAKPRHTQQQSLNDFVGAKLAAYHPKPHDCGDDWLCLVQWAEKEHPKKGKRHV